MKKAMILVCCLVVTSVVGGTAAIGAPSLSTANEDPLGPIPARASTPSSSTSAELLAALEHALLLPSSETTCQVEKLVTGANFMCNAGCYSQFTGCINSCDQNGACELVCGFAFDMCTLRCDWLPI